MNSYKLCYCKDNFAWFADTDPKNVWGDDWDDAPFEHNAGEPYREKDYNLIKVAFDGPLELPSSGQLNSYVSVEDINKGGIPWLTEWIGETKIYAGCDIKEFTNLVRKSGGNVYYKND